MEGIPIDKVAKGSLCVPQRKLPLALHQCFFNVGAGADPKAPHCRGGYHGEASRGMKWFLWGSLKNQKPVQSWVSRSWLKVGDEAVIWMCHRLYLVVGGRSCAGSIPPGLRVIRTRTILASQGLVCW